MEFDDGFYLVAVYAPNSGDVLQRLEYCVNQWDADFQSHLTSMPRPAILAGN
jgi:exonuclease III